MIENNKPSTSPKQEEINNSTEINSENIERVLKLVLQTAIDFWTNLAETEDCPSERKKEILGLKVVLTNKSTYLDELIVMGEHDLFRDINDSLRYLQDVFYFPSTGKIYLNFDNLTRREQVDLLLILVIIFHESVHKMQHLIFGESFFRNSSDPNISKENFGLDEDSVDKTLGVMFLYLETLGKADIDDFESIVNIHRNMGYKGPSPYDEYALEIWLKYRRSKHGHGNAGKRVENFKYGYELAKKHGYLKATLIIFEDTKVEYAKVEKFY